MFTVGKLKIQVEMYGVCFLSVLLLSAVVKRPCPAALRHSEANAASYNSRFHMCSLRKASNESSRPKTVLPLLELVKPVPRTQLQPGVRLYNRLAATQLDLWTSSLPGADREGF